MERQTQLCMSRGKPRLGHLLCISSYNTSKNVCRGTDSNEEDGSSEEKRGREGALWLGELGNSADGRDARRGPASAWVPDAMLMGPRGTCVIKGSHQYGCPPRWDPTTC